MLDISRFIGDGVGTKKMDVESGTVVGVEEFITTFDVTVSRQPILFSAIIFKTTSAPGGGLYYDFVNEVGAYKNGSSQSYAVTADYNNATGVLTISISGSSIYNAYDWFCSI